MALTGLINATAASTAAANSATKNTVSKDDFLKLFVTQLQKQDPMNPMDSTAFTAQLAQFSSLEQLTNISDALDTVLRYQGSLQNTLDATLIGKQVGYGATDSSGADITKYGTVTALTFDQGSTTVVLEDGTKIDPSSISEIR
ncbi:MAG: flagellar biosynthesis protein FlgD [Deltaproteobacteria bacterium]|nr:flagellar biosynthesis protein FlgD [Deltaproteobacteria bacterium]